MAIKTEGRDNSIDLLRLIATFLVFVTHALGPYLAFLSQEGQSVPTALCFYEALTACGVSTFFIISGAFVLANDRYASFKVFYSHITKTIVIPTLIFSLYYVLYAILPSALKGDFSGVRTVLVNTMQGRPFYHMWYLYTLFAIYLFVPAIIRLRILAGEKTFERIAILIFVSSVISELTSTHMFQYDPGSAYRYAGYLLIGYVIYNRVRKKGEEEKSGVAGLFPLIVWLVCLVVVAMGRYYLTYAGIPIPGTFKTCVYLIEKMYPALLFAAFAGFRISVRFPIFVSLGFNIYLLHAGIMDAMLRLTSVIFGKDALLRLFAPEYGVVLLSAFVFVISVIVAYLYDLLQKRVEAKLHIRQKIYEMIKRAITNLFGLKNV